MANHLYYGNNLDPPFNSQATYNVLFCSTIGTQSQAQIEVFADTTPWAKLLDNLTDIIFSGQNSLITSG